MKEYKVEHPLHSYVRRVDDSLKTMFTTNEIKEIEKESGLADMAKNLPESIAAILMKLQGKCDFDAIDEAFQKMHFNRKSEPDEYWCRNSILNYLGLFIEKDTVTPFVTEQDLNGGYLRQGILTVGNEMELTSLCHQDVSHFIWWKDNILYVWIRRVPIVAIPGIDSTTAETGCQSSASANNKNSRRELGTDDQLVRQASGDCADLTFKYLSSELGCVQIGLIDHGANGTKELQKSKLNSPKMMRNFCQQIVEQYKIKASKIKIVSYIINGSYLTAQIMTFTKGSIGILFTSPRLKMPETITEVPALLPPILTLVYNCALVMKEMADLLKKESSYVNLDPFRNSGYFFPDSFVPEAKDSFKKRKTSSP